MAEPTRGSVRRWRALSLALMCLLISLSGHLIGGGALSIDGIALCSGLFAVFSFLITGRRLGLLTLLPVIVASQLLGHALLSTTHSHHGGGPAHSTALMLIGHALAAIALAWILAIGDAAIFLRAHWLKSVVGTALTWCIGVLATFETARLPLVTQPAITNFRMPRHGPVGVIAPIVRRGPPQS